MDDAETAYNRALAMRVSPLAKAYSLRTLGRIHMNRGSREKAIEYFEQSLDIYRRIDIGGGDIRLTEDLLLEARANSDRGGRQ